MKLLGGIPFALSLVLPFNGVLAVPSYGQSPSSVVNQTTCAGQTYVYESLAGFGFAPSDARDKFGDTLGGFGSSVTIDEKSWQKSTVKGTTKYTGILYAIPDRGWNTQGTLNYQNRIHKLRITLTLNDSATADNPSPRNVELKYLDTILLSDPKGVPTTGLDPDIKGGAQFPGFPILPQATFVGDGFGNDGPGGKRVAIDSEGLVLARDGGYWISDEYGPYIYRFSAAGEMLAAIQPPAAYLPRRNGSISFNSNTPPIYNPDAVPNPESPESGRNNNQGLEGLTISPNGKKLFALMQSALNQEGGPDNPYRRQARFLEYDISNARNPKYVAEYVVTLPLYIDPTAEDPAKASKVAAQSAIHYLSDTTFLILSRDSGAGHGQDNPQSVYRHADIFSIATATNIKSRANDKTNGTIASSTGVLEAGVTAAEYCSFLDFNVNSQLQRFGAHNGGEQDSGLLNEKWESLALVPVNPEKDGKDGEWFMVSLSDNDFITQNGYLKSGQYRYQDESGFELDNQVLVFRVKFPKRLRPLEG